MRVGVLVSHPIQYFAPVYRGLAGIADIDLTVLFRTRVGADDSYDAGFDRTFKWDVPLLDGYPHEFLSTKRTLAGMEPRIVGEVLRRRFDVLLVHGYSDVTNLMGILAAKASGTKILLRGDTRLQRRHRNRPGHRLAKRLLFRLVDGFICIGKLNRDYYAWHGVRPERLFFAPFSVSNSAFRLLPEAHDKARQRCRAGMNVPNDAVAFLFASKLIKIKRADDLVRAFNATLLRCPSGHLIIAGSGNEEAALRRLATSLGICERVHFVGFKNQGELPSLYAAADIFILPSAGDEWGLVVNEAMAAGVAVIVSDEVGAAPDLVADKSTGIVFPCGDVEALAAAMVTLAESPRLRDEMAMKGQLLIDHWDAPICAQRIADACRAVAAR